MPLAMLRHSLRAATLRVLLPLAALAAPACGDDDTRTQLDASHVVDVLLADAGADSAAPPDTAVAPDSAVTPDTLAAPDTTSASDTQLPADTTVAPDTQVPLDSAGPEDTKLTSDSAAPTDTAAPADTAAAPCPTLPAGHARHVVLSRPFAEGGGNSPNWTVHPLLADAAVGPATATFALGLGRDGVVAFTPDGALAFAALEDGTLGVFTLAADGTPTIVAAGLDPGVYLSRVLVDGDRLLLVNPNWPESGGGVYAAPFDCHGTVGVPTLLYPTKNAHTLALRGADHVVAARAAGDATFGHLHLMRPGAAGFTRVGGADLFGHDDAILSALALTPDGRFALVGDNSEFSSVDTAIGAAALSDTGVTAVPRLRPFPDPMAIVASPHGDALLAVSGYSNAVRVIGYAPNAATPFTDLGPPTYVTQKPQLPSEAVLVGGAWPNHVLVVENVALRRFRFDGGQVVTDLGRSAEGSGLQAIPGAIGVQP